MILTFHVPPRASGQGLFDIGRVWFRVTQKNFKKIGSPSMAKLNHYLSEGENSNYRYNFAVPGLPKFLKFL